MKKQSTLFILLFISVNWIFFSGCVSKRAFRESQDEVAMLRSDSAQLADSIAYLQNNRVALSNEIEDMNKRLAYLKSQNNVLGDQTAQQQSQLNQNQQTLERERQRLMQLQSLLDKQDAESKMLKNKMSDALNSFNSNELMVTQKNGKVYISLSEALLFPSGSAAVNPRGVDALAKLAAVLNLNPDISVNIEGHTDSIPIRGKYKDNWELSTARANAIVRILTDNYKVDPVRVEASGHSKYDPVDVNSTSEGRARNRRTEIILSPKLDELYKLMES
jgi:chemotaxis protein MotB